MELSEIINGLRQCTDGGNCRKCILYDVPIGTDCGEMLRKAAADALEIQRNHIVALTEQLKEVRNEQS